MILGIIIGCIIGAVIGALIMALMVISSQSDSATELMFEQDNKM